MKIIFNDIFYDSDYSDDGAAVPGRMEAIIDELKKANYFEFESCSPASRIDLARAHEESYIDRISQNKSLFKHACYAAGGAIKAALSGFEGKPAFACARPPGHHAYPDSAWGYCYFSNMAISLLHLRAKRLIESAFVIDFDAHTGDGTVNVLSNWKSVKILNPMAEDSYHYIKRIEEYVADLPKVDIIAVSAGFDSYEKDVGRKLKTFDFYQIGFMMKRLSKRMGHKRRYALLEGGYYLPDLGKNVKAFCEGFMD